MGKWEKPRTGTYCAAGKWVAVPNTARNPIWMTRCVPQDCPPFPPAFLPSPLFNARQRDTRQDKWDLHFRRMNEDDVTYFVERTILAL